MKKHFTVLSDKVCTHPGCGRRLKQNLIDRNPKAEFCFLHWVLTKIPHLSYKRLHLKTNNKEGLNETL